MAKRRLFVGTFLPEAQRSALTVEPEAAARLAEEWGCKLRWVRPDKFHLTWVFLGSVDEELIPEIESKLAELLYGVPAMDLEYAGFKLWPHARKAKTFVVTPDTVPGQLMQLAERIKKEMTPYAERIDLRYRPHITLARMEPQSHRIAVPDWFPMRTKLPLRHHINRVDLIESHLGGSKDYESIKSWDLAE